MFVHDVESSAVVIARRAAVVAGGFRAFLRISQHDIRVTQSGEGQDSEAALVYIGRIIERDPE